MNPNAQKVIDQCEQCWPANSADCSGFVKAVCTALQVTMSPGQADDIVTYIRDASNGWDEIVDASDASGNVITRKEQLAKQAADNGKLVVCGLTAAELGDTNGHVCVIVSGDLVHSGQNHDYYPLGYWGKLHGTGKKNTSIAYAFGVGDIDEVHYAAISF